MVTDTQRSGRYGGPPATFHDVRDPEMAGGRDRTTGENTDLDIPGVEQGSLYVTQPWDLGPIPKFDLIRLSFLAYRKQKKTK